MSYEDLARALLVGEPYFGSAMQACQGVVERHKYFLPTLEALGAARPGPFEILEIGSWAGCSTVTWARAIEKLGRGGRVACLDAWLPYFDTAIDRASVYTQMNQAAEKDAIFALFRHNLAASGVDRFVRILRGDSRELLPTLPSGSFDLVYVDGNHRLDVVRADLAEAKRLVAEGGIVCGDDLELQRDELDPTALSRALDIGCDYAPASDFVSYHPGVTAAVAEAFGMVSAWEGFWAMRRSANGWTTVSLDMRNAALPEHLRRRGSDSEPPRLIRSVAGYNLVAYRERIYGLPQSLGTIDLASVDAATLPGVITGNSADAVTAEIKRLLPPAD